MDLIEFEKIMIDTLKGMDQHNEIVGEMNKEINAAFTVKEKREILNRYKAKLKS